MRGRRGAADELSREEERGHGRLASAGSRRAVTGACWHRAPYVASTDTLSRVGPDDRLEDIVTRLPGKGDHQTSRPLVGPDGKLYWGRGSATNTGVVGADNFAGESLPIYADARRTTR